jgi:hypothetical protein
MNRRSEEFERVVSGGDPFGGLAPLSVTELRALVRALARESERASGPLEAAAGLAATFERWRAREFPPRERVIARIAERSGKSPELLGESLDALLQPFTADALYAFARRIRGRLSGVGAFVMPANVPGAGLHELVGAIIAGASALIKVSSREPFFFTEFAASLDEIAPALGARAKAVVFARENFKLAAAMLESSDFAVVLGADETLSGLHCPRPFFGFGSRASGAFVTQSALEKSSPETVAALARDLTLFEQQGCLSPHHIFLECADPAAAARFGESMAEALSTLAQRLGPARLSFEAACAIRRVRESARWQRLGGRSVMLWEGSAMAWTVVMDPDARFRLSPGHRTVTITPVASLGVFEQRLAPMRGKLEAFSVTAGSPSADLAARLLERLGVTWICEPGSMQSPPLEWRHGGGAFLDFVTGATR